MENFKKASLIYTIAVLQFPHIPNIERFIDSFRDLIRGSYPEYDDSHTKTWKAHIGVEGIKLDDPQQNKIWQFSTCDRKWAFVITSQSFCLHTSYYSDFSDFSRRFIEGISALVKIPGIDIKYMKSIGIRYVNMISADEKVDLSYPLIMPVSHSSLQTIQSRHIIRYKTECGELRLQIIQNPSFALPPELNSVFIAKNGWIKEKPKSSFTLMDIDHFTNWKIPHSFNKNGVVDFLQRLRKTSKELFDSIATDKATVSWDK